MPFVPPHSVILIKSKPPAVLPPPWGLVLVSRLRRRSLPLEGIITKQHDGAAKECLGQGPIYTQTSHVRMQIFQGLNVPFATYRASSPREDMPQVNPNDNASPGKASVSGMQVKSQAGPRTFAGGGHRRSPRRRREDDPPHQYASRPAVHASLWCFFRGKQAYGVYLSGIPAGTQRAYPWSR